uniref:Ovule protein n=1 Tax=Meloidogyne incognita TaxID=6306 RepID=A0A914LPN4_MELIC
MFFRSNTQLIVERMMPNLLHVVPVCYNSVLNRVFQSQDTSFALSFISHIRILLTHSNHNSLMSRTTDNTWKNGTRSIITRKSSL